MPGFALLAPAWLALKWPGLDWMEWTTGTALFVAGVLLSLIALAIIGVIWPSTPRKGFLPMRTARGDRIYVGLLGTGLIHILVIALTDLPLTFALGLAGVWMVVVLRWG